MNKIGYHGMIVNAQSGGSTAATITVYAAGTTTLSTIYSNAAGGAKANPLVTDDYGRFSFFADPGEYDIKVTGTGFTTYTLSGVSIPPVITDEINLTPKATSTGAEGTIFYCSTDDHVYVGTE